MLSKVGKLESSLARNHWKLKALTNLTSLGLYWVILALHYSCTGLALLSS